MLRPKGIPNASSRHRHLRSKRTPLDRASRSDRNPIARFSIDKQFHGALKAAGKGETLSGMGTVKGSGGFVAIERVTGTLDPRSATFTLQHNGTSQNGNYNLNVIVVPDSGTAQLTGLEGSMEIIMQENKHSYDLTYTLPAPNKKGAPVCALFVSDFLRCHLETIRPG